MIIAAPFLKSQTRVYSWLAKKVLHYCSLKLIIFDVICYIFFTRKPVPKYLNNKGSHAEDFQ